MSWHGGRRPISIPEWIIRGDEMIQHLSGTHTKHRWYCPLHGAQDAIPIESGTEHYFACKDCLYYSPQVILTTPEELTDA